MNQPLRTPAFDWDEARRLRALGWTYQRIADELGVSHNAVTRVVNPNELARSREYDRAYGRRNNAKLKTLCECGRRMRWHSHSCTLCQAEAVTTSVRDTTLRCSTCREWKPDSEFSPKPGLPVRRCRDGECKPCGAARKREERRRARKRAA